MNSMPSWLQQSLVVAHHLSKYVNTPWRSLSQQKSGLKLYNVPEHPDKGICRQNGKDICYLE